MRLQFLDFRLWKHRSTMGLQRSTILRWCRKTESYFWARFVTILWGLLLL